MTDKIAVVLLTARTKPEREKYAIATLKSLSNLGYSGEIRLHIADDGSGKEYQESLRQLADEEGWTGVTLTDSGRVGYGANYNLAMHFCHEWADYIMPVEDDWELTMALDLDD